MQNPFKLVPKPQLGFTVPVPDGWAEFPPITSNSPYEVARFARRDHTHHLCVVFRMPGSAALDPRTPAEDARVRLTASGYGNFAIDDARVAGRAGVRLTCDKARDSGVWAARLYFVSAGDLVFCLGLGSGDPAGDAPLFESMSAAFEVAG